MILINSSANISEPRLISLETTLTTSAGVYEISSTKPMNERDLRYGGLFGAMSWPISRFQLASGVVLEQQMFLPQNGSTAAFSWQLKGNSMLTARLTVKPFFRGCGPRSYRDIGFRREEESGQLGWLPNVRGPRMLADTNGHYHDEPTLDRSGESSNDDLFAPGIFEFELSSRPSVLILSKATTTRNSSDQHLGAFLAGLMPNTDIVHHEPRTALAFGSLIKAA